MAAKILFAVVAALCAFQVLVADQQFSAKQQLLSPDPRFINITEILEGVERILNNLQESLHALRKSIEEKIQETLDTIEQNAIAHANKWNATIQEWVDVANAAGVEIRECFDQNMTLGEVAAQFRNESRDCVESQIKAMEAAFQDVADLVPQTTTLLSDTRAVIKKCTEGHNPISSTFCFSKETPYLTVRATRLSIDMGLLTTRAALEVGLLLPTASLCVSKVAAGSAADASSVVGSVVSCIRGKLEV